MIQKTLFLQGADSGSADFKANLFAVDNHSLGLQVWLPDFELGAVDDGEVVVAPFLLFVESFVSCNL